MLAASFAGIGFGNAGVHLCHGINICVRVDVQVMTGMSYPVSGLVKGYKPDGYNHINKPLVPHGSEFISYEHIDSSLHSFCCVACTCCGTICSFVEILDML